MNKLELAGLDAAEAESIHQFLEAQNGEPFSFTDPVTGETANKCVVAGEARTGLDVGLRSTSVLAIAEVL